MHKSHSRTGESYADKSISIYVVGGAAFVNED